MLFLVAFFSQFKYGEQKTSKLTPLIVFWLVVVNNQRQNIFAILSRRSR